jgi:carnosine N-methyltransferase
LSPWNNQDGATADSCFSDTAPNIIRYVEAVKNCLRSGGLFVNVGPLLWHFENNAPGQHGREKDAASEPASDNSNAKGEM